VEDPNWGMNPAGSWRHCSLEAAFQQLEDRCNGVDHYSCWVGTQPSSFAVAAGDAAAWEDTAGVFGLCYQEVPCLVAAAVEEVLR
jgi:hypothetical protein